MVFSLFVTWFLTGFWHGANWTFATWGLFYFALLRFEWVTGFNKLQWPKYLKWLPHFYVLFCVNIGHILFRSPNFAFAGKYIAAMFGAGTNFIDDTFLLYFANGKWFLLAGVILSMPIVPFVREKFTNKKLYAVFSSVGLIILFTLSLLVCIKSTYNPFIYFNF
jgi:hypothetical protein